MYMIWKRNSFIIRRCAVLSCESLGVTFEQQCRSSNYTWMVSLPYASGCVSGGVSLWGTFANSFRTGRVFLPCACKCGPSSDGYIRMSSHTGGNGTSSFPSLHPKSPATNRPTSSYEPHFHFHKIFGCYFSVHFTLILVRLSYVR